MVTPKHLLVIRLSAMGDVAMTVPVLASLTQQYPELKITVLTREFFTPIFSQLPNVSVYNADVKGKHKGVLGLFKLYKELKTLKIDAVADLHNVLRSNILKTYFSLGGISVIQVDKGRTEKKTLTVLKPNKNIEPLKTTHQRYADVFKKFGFVLNLEKVLLPSKMEVAFSTKEKIGIDTKKWIGIAPFAAFTGKMYPFELMEKVVSNLNNTNKYKIILFGGGSKEKEQLSVWEKQYSNTINIVDQVSFSEELAIISNLDIMLAMDSGNAHLSANYGIPTITLWGVTHPFAGFYPFGQPIENSLLADRKKYPFIPTSVYGNKFPKGYENVMETISPESVIVKIEECMN